MKEARISLSCATASNATMSTCFRRYHNAISVSGSKVESYSVPQTTIQVLAAFTPDGYFNNNFISKHKVV